MIDTHCHLDSERFDADRDEVLARAFDAGVKGIIIPGVGPRNWDTLPRMRALDSRLHLALGIHPQMLPELSPQRDGECLERLDSLLGQGGSIAVGECGLDGPSLPNAPLERQLFVLARHFELARKHHLPVLMHCHRLHPAFRDFLKTTPLPEAGVLLHSYSGGVDFAGLYAKRGCYFSFAGPITYPGARKPLDALRAIPLDRLMLETDAPDQAPAPHRSERSEPAYLPLIAQAMATVRGVSLLELQERTTANARTLFGQAL